ncbi:YPDG domain-containing protein, partial [Corynebacterium sp. HMSC30G07]|uniref:YPDG domain-containing protein n=1 Tax=Corynebacterium sp. HMSC30G07 TaxID=1581072 RepID=UPI000A4AC45E
MTVDKGTGEVSVKVPEDAKPGSEFTVPVKVTYRDGSEDTVDVTVEVEKNDNEKFEPEYLEENGKPGEDVTVGAPTFTDDAGNPAEKPESTTFKKGEDAPEGVTVNEDGSVKVTIPEGAEPGTKIEVPVVVTYPDGSEDTVEAAVKVNGPKTTVDSSNVTP